jgi:CheY-like chemotaxis protein
VAGLHVLHIDPDEATLAYVRRALEGQGYRSSTATTAEEGLAAAGRERPEVVLLELDLPGLDGLEVIRRIRQDPQTAFCVVAVLTGRAEGESEGAAREAGASEFLRKQSNALELLIRFIRSLPGSGAAEGGPQAVPPGHQLVVFLSANGGSGTSTLCVNLAHEIARFQPDRSVAVADLVLPIGSLAEIVGIASAVNLASLAARPEAEWSPESFRSMLPRADAWGFYVLPGCSDPRQAQGIRAEQFDALVGAMRRAFDILIVDIGKNLSRLSLKVLSEATLNVAVLIPQAAQLTASRSLLSYLAAEGIPAWKFFLLSNRAISELGLAGGPLEAALTRPVEAGIQHLGADLAISNQQHLPLTQVNPEAPGSVDFHDVAVQLIARLRQGR